MSYALQPLSTVLVQDPLVAINEKREMAVLKGGSEVSYKEFVAQSQSTSSTIFSCTPPSPQIIVDRKMYIKVPIDITLTCAGGVDQLKAAQVNAFRAFPLAHIMNTLKVEINNTSVTSNVNDYVIDLLRYNNFADLSEYELSGTPSFPDEYAEYTGASLNIRNPLGQYRDGAFGNTMARGGFPMTVTYPTNTTCRIQADLYEPLFISPLVFGMMADKNQAGLIGVQTLTITVNWDTNLARVWSSGSTGQAAVTNVAVSFRSNPSITMKFITPGLLVPIPSIREYGYTNVNRYITSVGAVNAGAAFSQGSQNIQFQAIPRRVYIYVKESKSALSASVAAAVSATDSYAAIDSISINWNNRSGLLSSAKQFDLYNISKKNGCALSWTQWSGKTQNWADGASIGTVGSVLCINFGEDIGLADDEASSVGGTYQFQVEVRGRSIHANAKNYDLYIVECQEGTFSIQENRAVSQTAVLSRKDVLDSVESPLGDYYDYHAMAGSGAFLQDAKSVLSKVLRGLAKGAKTALPYVKRGADYVEKGLPAFERGLDTLGMGAMAGGAMAGGELRGGKAKKGGAVISRAELQQRLMGK